MRERLDFAIDPKIKTIRKKPIKNTKIIFAVLFDPSAIF